MSELPKILPRDGFIDEIFSAAKTNRDIYFITADLGAKALDRFRLELPGPVHSWRHLRAERDGCGGRIGPERKDRLYLRHGSVRHAALLRAGEGGGGLDVPAGDHYRQWRGLQLQRCRAHSLRDRRHLLHARAGRPGDPDPRRHGFDHRYCQAQSHTQPAFRYIRLDRTFLPPVYPRATSGSGPTALSKSSRAKTSASLPTATCPKPPRKPKQCSRLRATTSASSTCSASRPIDGTVLARVLAPYRTGGHARRAFPERRPGRRHC